jgi:hypothetical protein
MQRRRPGGIGASLVGVSALLAVSAVLVLAGLTELHAEMETPTLTTAFRKIADTKPDISPYSYTKNDNNVCDFTIFHADDGTWQLIACIRNTTYPGSTRFLYRWEGTRLDRGEFIPKGIFWTSGTRDTPDALGRTLGVNTPYTAEGRLQAPHCVKHGGKYYLFHNNAGAFCLISDDGKNWTQHQTAAGSDKFFDMGRDVMVFDNRDDDGKWVAYYTDPSTSPQSVAAKTATDLDGPWSSSTIRSVYDGHSGLPSDGYANEYAESPFVYKRGEHDYYLWIQRYVLHSNDPYAFSTVVTCMDGGDEWAPEIFQDASGQFYIAFYKIWGIYVAKFEWTGDTPTTALRSGKSRAASVTRAPLMHVKHASVGAGTLSDLLGRRLGCWSVRQPSSALYLP